MAPERDEDLPPIQPSRRMAVVRGLRARLWPKRVLPRPSAPAEEAKPEPPPPAEEPVTYDDQAHLHGGPAPRPKVDLED